MNMKSLVCCPNLFTGRQRYIGMSIGRDPREWILEIGGVAVGVYGTIIGLLRADYTLALVCLCLLLITMVHLKMRKEFSISVRDHR